MCYKKCIFYFVLVLLLAPPAGGKMIENAFSRPETLRVSTPSSHGRTIRLVGLKLHSRGVLRAAPDVKKPKTKILRASRAGHHEPPRSRIPERKSAYLAKRAHLQRLQKGTYLITFFCLQSCSQGTPTERSLAAPALGEACVSKKSPMVRDRGVIQKMHIYFAPVLLAAPLAGRKFVKSECPDKK